MLPPSPRHPPDSSTMLNWRSIGAGNVVQFCQQAAKATPGGKTCGFWKGTRWLEQALSVTLKDESLLTVSAWTSASRPGAG